MLPIINMVFVSHDAVHALNANIDTLVLRLLDETTAFHLTIKETQPAQLSGDSICQLPHRSCSR